jgi:hypothetical protein
MPRRLLLAVAAINGGAQGKGDPQHDNRKSTIADCASNPYGEPIMRLEGNESMIFYR